MTLMALHTPGLLYCRHTGAAGRTDGPRAGQEALLPGDITTSYSFSDPAGRHNALSVYAAEKAHRLMEKALAGPRHLLQGDERLLRSMS
jgi:hypothetical protein